jgi:superfamily I DNA and/or RNA helicase
MDEEYGRMITMYQKAFQEIIDFKNQYMEEVMKMRERVIKEREEILEYEKVKH